MSVPSRPALSSGSEPAPAALPRAGESRADRPSRGDGLRLCRGAVGRSCRALAVISLTLLGVGVAPAEAAEGARPFPTAAEVVETARLFLGGEDAIEAIQTLRYSGQFINFLEGKQGTFTIYLKKPLSQRTEFDDGVTVTTTVFDGMEGWTRVSRKDRSQPPVLKILDPAERRQMRRNTHDNLFFFSQLERIRASAEMVGPALHAGFEVWEVLFRFDDGSAFRRFFERDTGELLGTISPSGVTIREVGSMRVAGVRFPRQVDAYFEGEVINRILYREIGVNEDLPDTLFDFPTLQIPLPGSPLPRSSP